MLHRLCFSFRCRFCSEMQGRTTPRPNANVLSTGGPWPPPTFAASRQRRDLIIAHPRGEVSKGEGSRPLPFGRFKVGGFSRGKGNRNPFPLEWRFWLLLSLLTKVTRRRQKEKDERGKGGNRNPPFLKWRSLDTFFRQGKKVSRRRQMAKGNKREIEIPSPLNGVFGYFCRC